MSTLAAAPATAAPKARGSRGLSKRAEVSDMAYIEQASAKTACAAVKKTMSASLLRMFVV
jgi:hypothetical protein